MRDTERRTCGSLAETLGGCAVMMEPTDICIDSQPPLPARIAFFTGPTGEEVELFCEKG